ncbi:MAG: acyltransferase [Pseudomonadota bacterium]
MKDNSKIYSLQMLRAIAASFVLLAHSQNFLHARSQINELNPFLQFGSAGVDLFFIISGFIMVIVSKSKFQQPGASFDFIIRRIIRVVPMYWLYTILIATLLVLFPQYFSAGKQFDMAHFMASLFFIPWPNNVNMIKPVLGIGWTLNSEMYFYMIFSFLLIFPFKKLIPYLSFILFIGVLSGVLYEVDIAQLSIITSPLVLEFLIGCIIGAIYIKNYNISKLFALSFLIIGIFGYFITSTPLPGELGINMEYPSGEYGRFIKWGIPSAFLVFGVIFLERLKAIPINYFMVKLGDSSYSLYLTHIFVINALGVLWIRFIHDYYNLFIVVVFFLSIYIGHLAYLIIEKPVIDYLNKHYIKHKKAKESFV